MAHQVILCVGHHSGLSSHACLSQGELCREARLCSGHPGEMLCSQKPKTPSLAEGVAALDRRWVIHLQSHSIPQEQRESPGETTLTVKSSMSTSLCHSHRIHMGLWAATTLDLYPSGHKAIQGEPEPGKGLQSPAQLSGGRPLGHSRAAGLTQAGAKAARIYGLPGLLQGPKRNTQEPPTHRLTDPAQP